MNKVKDTISFEVLINLLIELRKASERELKRINCFRDRYIAFSSGASAVTLVAYNDFFGKFVAGSIFLFFIINSFYINYYLKKNGEVARMKSYILTCTDDESDKKNLNEVMCKIIDFKLDIKEVESKLCRMYI